MDLGKYHCWISMLIRAKSARGLCLCYVGNRFQSRYEKKRQLQVTSFSRTRVVSIYQLEPLSWLILSSPVEFSFQSRCRKGSLELPIFTRAYESQLQDSRISKAMIKSSIFSVKSGKDCYVAVRCCKVTESRCRQRVR